MAQDLERALNKTDFSLEFLVCRRVPSRVRLGPEAGDAPEAAEEDILATTMHDPGRLHIDHHLLIRVRAVKSLVPEIWQPDLAVVSWKRFLKGREPVGTGIRDVPVFDFLIF